MCNVLLLIYQEQQYEHEQAHTFYESRRAFSYDTLVVDASKNSNTNELVLTQDELAEILGMSRVNLTRILVDYEVKALSLQLVNILLC